MACSPTFQPGTALASELARASGPECLAITPAPPRSIPRPRRALDPARTRGTNERGSATRTHTTTTTTPHHTTH